MGKGLKKITSGRYQLKYRGTQCRNCNHPLDISDRYCPYCSQENSTKKLTLKDFFDEFFASVISYDSKLLKTLTALLLKPGKITKDYINGKRKSYTNPFRFLLSLSIIYFLLVNISSNFDSLNQYGVKNNDGLINKNGIININLYENKDIVDSIATSSEIDRYLLRRENKDSLFKKNPKNYFSSFKDSSFFKRYNHKREFFSTSLRLDSIYFFNKAVNKYNLNNSNENKFAFNSAKGILKLQQQPGSFINAIISRLPFAIFFFLPVFAFFIWMIYIRKKYTYTDHIIFSFHNQSLLFILLILSYLINTIFNTNSDWIFLLLFLIYLYKGMRNFYQQRRFITIIKYLFLNMIFVILGILTLVIVLTGSIFTF